MTVQTLNVVCYSIISCIIIAQKQSLFAGCPELSDANGVFSFTNGLFVGSNATLTCQSGFEFNTSPVTCMETGWTGTPMCERKNCSVIIYYT